MNFADIIMDGKMNMIAAQMESGENCQSLENDLMRLVEADIIDIQVALDSAKRPDAMKQELIRKGYLQG
jgi:Tfp pilus assembly pilus retraction ATPase PilT